MSRETRRFWWELAHAKTENRRRLYCLDRRSVSGVCQGNSEASAADKLAVSLLTVSLSKSSPVRVVLRIGCSTWFGLPLPTRLGNLADKPSCQARIHGHLREFFRSNDDNPFVVGLGLPGMVDEEHPVVRV